MAVLSIAEYRTYASIATGDTSLDGPLSFIVPGVCTAIERETGRTFAAATFTEYLDGAGGPRLAIKNPPISSITSVAIVDSTPTVLVTYATTDYVYDSEPGTITLISGGWNTGWVAGVTDDNGGWGQGLPIGGAIEPGGFPRGTRNIKVVYAGGYGAVPADLKLIACELVAVRMALKDDPTILSETTGQRSVVRTQPFGGGSQVSPQEAAILERVRRFRRYTWA